MISDGKSKDVVCFAKPYIDGKEFLDQVFELAKSLPDRQVLISFKRNTTRLGGHEEFLAYIKKAPANIAMASDNSFDMIKTCRYVVGGESAILSEALNLGSFSFFLDSYPEEHQFVYREYSNMSYKRGNDIASRIMEIEAGTWRYPIEEFEDLTDLSGWIGYDVIRREIGLGPKNPPVLAKLWNDFRIQGQVRNNSGF